MYFPYVLHQKSAAFVLATSLFQMSLADGSEKAETASNLKMTSSYELSISAPKTIKRGEKLVGTVKVVPRGGYKINLEFPMKLQVGGPPAASPQKQELKASQAAKLTHSLLLLSPTFQINATGQLAFNGTLRFSVCTEKQCEIKTEKISWTTVSR